MKRWRWYHVVLAILGALVLALALVLGLNWSMVQSFATTKTRGVEILEGYKPLAVVEGVSAAQEAPSPATPLPALDEAFAYSDGHDGLAMIVARKGEILREAYAPGFGPQSRFETFSMHKSVMGLLYGAALRDKVIGTIDDPVGIYIQEWSKDPRGAIPLRAFLSMASGLKFYSLNKSEWPAMKLVLSNEVTRTALSVPIEAPALTTFEYYNVNSQIAGVALDRALKKAGEGGYAAYLSKALWRPIGAASANLWLEREGGDPRFFSGLQARARDWLKLGALIANKGQVDGQEVIPSAWIAEMTAPSPLNPNYGLQIWRGSPWAERRAYGPRTPFKVPHAQAYLAEDLVFFDGFGGERVYIVPSLDLVIVRIGKVRIDFDDSAIPNAVIRGLGLAP